MEWFQPDIFAIFHLSLFCIELVFMVFLLRLQGKTKDCYLIISIFAASISGAIVRVLIYSTASTPFILIVLDFFFDGLNIFAVLNCSYLFYKNNYPKESRIVIAAYPILFCIAVFLWFKDYYRYHHVTLTGVLSVTILQGAIISFSAINYIRKLKTFLKGRSYSLWKELVTPSQREVAVFSGFAFSLSLYVIAKIIDVLDNFIVMPANLEISGTYLLSLSITVVCAFAYFNYAREKTSFEAKLVGVALFLTLRVITIIAMGLFGTENTSFTAPLIKLLLIIVPVVTLLVSLLLPLLFRITVLKPLKKIVKGVQEVSSGDLNASVDLEITDEIGWLSQNFNKMTTSLRKRTEQLESMRETIATDFHDQTGNMLSAITRQAGLLKLKLGREHELQPIIKSIVDNSNNLYASSKDFLWQLNHNSEDPNELFDYLTGHGQVYYNQFDIAFSAQAEDCRMVKLDPTSALNLIFIFKEAMTNVVKHAGASQVTLTMQLDNESVVYTLEDNGSWKEASTIREHYGLANMERRCRKTGFGFTLSKQTSGTRISVIVLINETHL